MNAISAEDGADVQLDRLGADAQCRGNGVVGAALEDPLQHVLLAGRQAHRARATALLVLPPERVTNIVDQG